MRFYSEADIWGVSGFVPHTTTKAKPTAKRNFSNAQLIVAKDAYYRGATFSGTFVLAEAVGTVDKSTRRVKVFCRWFNHRLKTREPKFLINLATAKIINGGEAYTNLTR